MLFHACSDECRHVCVDNIPTRRGQEPMVSIPEWISVYVWTRNVDPDPHSFSLLDPDPHLLPAFGYRKEKYNEKQEMQGNRWLAFYYGTCFTVNLDQLQFFVSFFISRKLFIKFFSQICLAWIRIRIKKAAGSRSALRKTARSGSAKNECGWDQQLWCGQYYDPSRPGTMMVSSPEA